MWLLTLRDLQHRRLRVLVVVVLVSVVMALLFLMTGLVNQFHHEPFDATRAIGGRQWVLAAGTSGPFTAGGTVPADLVDELGAGAAGVVVARGTASSAGDGDRVEDTMEVVVVGGDPTALRSTMAAPALVEGRTVEADDEMLVDRSAGYDVGDVVQLGPRRLEVVGLTSGTTVLAGLPIAFVQLATAQDLYFDSRQVVSGVLLDERPVDPPAGTVVLTADEVAADALDPLDDAIGSIDLVRGLLWLVTAVILGAVVFLSALERQRDFAVLRAIGTPRRTLLVSVATQAVVIAVASALVAMVLQVFLQPLFPMEVSVPPAALWQIPLGAVVLAVLASGAGMRKVASTDPAAAFGGTG